MKRYRLVFIVIGVVIAMAGLAVIRYRQLHQSGSNNIAARQELKVGFLPVT